MFLASTRGIGFLAADTLTKHSRKISTALEEKDGQLREILSPAQQNKVYDELNLDSINIKAKELFAITTVFEFDKNEYHAVLQKEGNSNVAKKVFKKTEKGLEESKFNNFINGVNGDYYNPEDISKFIAALAYKSSENPKQYLNFSQDFVTFIKQNMHLNPKTKQQTLMVNVNNIRDWTKHVDKNVTNINTETSNAEIKVKIKDMYKYLSEEKVDTIVDTYMSMLKKGTFNTITPEHITKITLADIPTMQRFLSGQIEEGDNPHFDARNKMITSFLSSRKDFNIIECSAANYLLSGVTNTNIPIFYNSTLIEDNTERNTKNFFANVNEASKDITAHLKTDNTITGLLNFLKEKNKDGKIYSYAYLKMVRDVLPKYPSDKISLIYNIIEKVSKEVTQDSRLLSQVYGAKRNNADEIQIKKAYSEVIQNALLIARADYQNDLKIIPTQKADKIFNSKHGQKLPIELFYSTHEQIANFQKKVGLRKDYDSIETFYGTSLVGITELENKEGKLTPIKTHRFDYQETNFEQISGIIDKFSKITESSELIYEKVNDDMKLEKKIYPFDISKNITNLVKNIDNKFRDKDGNIYKSYLTVAESIIDGVKKISFADKNNTNLAEKVRAIQNVIKAEVVLQKLQELGEAKKPDFNKIMTIRTAALNVPSINKLIYKNKDNLTGDSLFIKNPKYPAFIKDTEDGKSLANKSVTGLMLDLAKNIKIYNSVNMKDNDTESSIAKIKEISEGKSRYDEFINKEQMAKIKESEFLTIKNFVKSVSSLIAAKHTQSIPNSLNYWTSQAVIAEYYPIVEETQENEKVFTNRKTNSENILNLIGNKKSVFDDLIHQAKEEVEAEYKILRKKQSEKKAKYSLDFDDKNTMSNVNNDIESKKNDAESGKTIDMSMLHDNIEKSIPTQIETPIETPIEVEESIEVEEIKEEIQIESIVNTQDEVNIPVDIKNIEFEDVSLDEIEDKEKEVEEEEIDIYASLEIPSNLDFSEPYAGLEIKVPNLDDIIADDYTIVLDDYSAAP